MLDIIATIVTSSTITTVLSVLLTRKKYKSEIDTYKAAAQKTEAERDTIVVEAANKVVEMISHQLDSMIADNQTLKSRIKELEDENYRKEGCIRSLERQISSYIKEVAKNEAIIEELNKKIAVLTLSDQELNEKYKDMNTPHGKKE